MPNATHRSLAFVRIAPLFAALAGVGAAQSQGWRVDVTPYVWATDVSIDTRLAGRQVVDETIPVKDLIEDIDVTFQGRLEAQNGAHGVLLDVFYVSMSDEVGGFALPNGAGSGDLDWKLDMSLVDVAGIYDPRGDRKDFSFLYGARLIDQRAEVDARFTTASGVSQQHYEADETLVDVLLGVRYRRELTCHLSFNTQLDVSTGGTDHTWSTFPSLAWSFGGGRASLLAGYRYLSVDFDDVGGLDTELSLSGPLVGLRLSL